MRTMISFVAVVITVALVASSLSSGTEVGAIQVRGKAIKVGDTADYVFGILTKDEMVSQDVRTDPNNPNSLLVTKNFRVDGQSFTITSARVADPGPYVVVKIILDHVNSPRVDNKLSITSFESSSFLQKHKPAKKDQWKLKSGGMNYYYRFPDPENPYSNISVELSSAADDLKEFAVEWYGESTLKPAAFTSSKESFLRDLLATILPQVKADTVISYVRSQRGKDYPGGGNAIPRKDVGGVLVYSGTCGEALIVGFEK